MTSISQDRSTKIATELKSIICKYEHRSFTANICFLSNVHIRKGTGQVKLKSPVRQVMYLISLYHATAMDGKELYMAESKEHKKIIRLLNKIETGYIYQPEKEKRDGISKEEFDRIRITTGTLMNFYFNATLSYVEQDIERIKRTFIHHKEYILKETGIALSEYIEFFLLLTKMEIERLRGFDEKNWVEKDPVIKKVLHERGLNRLTQLEKLHVVDFVDKKMYSAAIPMQDIFEKMDQHKAKQLIVNFTLLRKENSDYLYYTDECPLLKKPIIIMDGHSMLMPYSKQLINAIYDYLYQLCDDPNTSGRKISERRDLYLEDKTAEVFEDFFDPSAIFQRSYYLNGEEKDLLILNERTAYIIECKAHKQRAPLRNADKAYDRINDDFQRSIGKAYEQANTVEQLLLHKESFTIKNKQNKTIMTINPIDYDEVFVILVTQERLGQIQCDLGLLLQVKEDFPYPWSVCINDLESFLITLKRKDRATQQFENFLLLREQLHERLASYDELEVCSYFLFDNEAFAKNCNNSGFFYSQPDIDQFFDLLYYVGFGLKDELNLAEKVKRKDMYADSVINYHKLKPADRVHKFLNQETTK